MGKERKWRGGTRGSFLRTPSRPPLGFFKEKNHLQRVVFLELHQKLGKILLKSFLDLAKLVNYFKNKQSCQALTFSTTKKPPAFGDQRDLGGLVVLS